MKIVKENFLNYKDTYIYQDKNSFCYGIDAVLLGNFININQSDKNIIDLGTGNIPIPLILYKRFNKKIDCVELQDSIYELGKKTIEVNKLENFINLYHEDIKNLPKVFKRNSYDVISINPPYFTNGKNSDKVSKTFARHEKSVNLDEILKVVNYLLTNKGHFYIINRSERFFEVIDKLKTANLIPKRVKFVYPREDSESKLFLIDCIKAGKDSVKVESPIFLYNGNEYRKEIKEMLGDIHDTKEL